MWRLGCICQKCQEPANRKLSAQSIVLPTEHLFTHNHTDFDNLDKKTRKRAVKCARAETTTVLTTCPPCVVHLIMLEFTRQEDGDEDLADGAFNEYHRGEAWHCMGSVIDIDFQEAPHALVRTSHRLKRVKSNTHQELKETDHSGQREQFNNEHNDRSKLDAARIHHQSQEHGEQELHRKGHRISDDRAK